MSKTIGALDGLSSLVEEEITTSTIELDDDELNQVCGGINPQPFPPRRIPPSPC
jgi:hypothetical protein